MPLDPGPNEFCTDCGRRMVWQRETDYPGSWMCPNCVLIRCDRLTRERDSENERWASRLDFIHREAGTDGSGTESGDALDVIEAEAHGAIEKLKEAKAELAALRPVVEAACALKEAEEAVRFMSNSSEATREQASDAAANYAIRAREVCEAVDAYRASQPQGGSDGR